MSEALHTLPLGFKKAVCLHAGLGVLLVKGDAQHRRVCGTEDLSFTSFKPGPVSGWLFSAPLLYGPLGFRMLPPTLGQASVEPSLLGSTGQATELGSPILRCS